MWKARKSELYDIVDSHGSIIAVGIEEPTAKKIVDAHNKVASAEKWNGSRAAKESNDLTN